MQSFLKNNWIELTGVLILFGSYISNFRYIESWFARIFLLILCIVLSYFMFSFQPKKPTEGAEEGVDINTINKDEEDFLKVINELEELDKVDLDPEASKLLLAKTLNNLSGGDKEKTIEHLKLLIQREFREGGQPMPSVEDLDEMAERKYLLIKNL